MIFLHDHIQELAQLALLFTDRGVLKREAYTAGTGVWTRADAKELAKNPMAYVKEIVIDDSHRGKGVGSWAISHIWETDVFRTKGSVYLITWPALLTRLQPPRINRPFGELTAEESQAADKKLTRIRRFYHRVSQHLPFPQSLTYNLLG